jgi:hypothetical protein
MVFIYYVVYHSRVVILIINFFLAEPDSVIHGKLYFGFIVIFAEIIVKIHVVYYI